MTTSAQDLNGSTDSGEDPETQRRRRMYDHGRDFVPGHSELAIEAHFARQRAS